MIQKLLALLVFCIHRLISLTWRVQIIISPELEEDLKNGTPAALAHWHGEQSGLVLSIRRLRASIMTSLSNDGAIMTRFVELYGAKTVRGSSSRGGASALRGIIRLSQQGFNPAIAVDGPRGPFHSVKPGIFEISRLTNAKIYPGVVVATNAWPFSKTWDKSFFPKPFSKVVIYWDSPMDPVPKSLDTRSDELARNLCLRLETAREKALKYIVE